MPHSHRRARQRVPPKTSRPACRESLAQAEDLLLGRARSRRLGDHLLLVWPAIAQLLRGGAVVGPAVVERRKAELHFAPLRMAVRLQLRELLAKLAREPGQVLD